MTNLFASRSRRGFTLVELIVVIAIIAVLVAIAVPAMTGYLQNAKEQVVASDCRSVATAATTAYLITSTLPEIQRWDAFCMRVREILPGEKDKYGEWGTGTYQIWFGADGTGKVLDAGAIHHITYTKDGTTATWTASTSEITLS